MIKVSTDPLYLLLREGKVQDFNNSKPKQGCDFSSCNFRIVDLRGLDAADIDFSDAYFRGADLRGIDLRQSKLTGASLAGARVSGTYFPAEFSAEEIRLSIEHGTRLRGDAKD